MNIEMLRSKTLVWLGCLVLVSCTSQPSVREADLQIADKNVLGATYEVCTSATRWNGVNFTIEGLRDGEGNRTMKTFTLGSTESTPIQKRLSDNMADAIQSTLKQLCQSTLSLRDNPQALGSYITVRDGVALLLFDLLQRMEQIDKSSQSTGEAIARQQKLFRQMTGAARQD